MPVRPIADPDPFDVLGVSEHSSDEVINAAWRRQMRMCHPDHAVGDADRERRLAKSIALNKAHDTLLDPELKARAILDRRGRARPPEQSTARPRTQPRDTWDGAQWTRYRAGGHPEARDTWSYKEPAAPPPEPLRSRSLLARSPAPVRIVLIALRVLVSTVWTPIGAILRYALRVQDPFYPYDVYGDDDD